MKKIWRKFIKNCKSGLAGFLKEYLLEYVDASIGNRRMFLDNGPIVVEIPFETITMRQIVAIHDLNDLNQLSILVKQVKEKFAKEIVNKYIHIDPTKLIEFGNPYEKGIEIILRVQKPQIY